MPLEKPKPRRALWALGIAIAIIALGYIFGPSGTVRGTEFSPDIFSHRSFEYVQWCGIQVTPTHTEVWQTESDRYLHNQGFISPSIQSEPRWYFIKGFAPHVRGWFGPAKPMCQGIGCFGGRDRWIRWSEANPKFASIVWPKVVIWARDEQFDTILCLFKLTDLDTATSISDVETMLASAEELASA